MNKPSYITNTLISALISLAPSLVAYLNDASFSFALTLYLQVFVVFFVLFRFYGMRLVLGLFLILIFTLSFMEISLLILNNKRLLNLASRKMWFHFKDNPNLVLVCYPSDPSKYFDIDLRNEQVRKEYNFNDRQWNENPFCIEERLNSLGYREREVSNKTRIPRIIFLGDSFALGEGVRLEDRFSEVLSRSYLNGQFEIYNFAVCGANIREILEKQFNDALKYQPDILIYCWNLNDPLIASGEIGAQQKYINDLMNQRYYNSSLNKFFDDKLKDNTISISRYSFYKIEKDILLNSQIVFLIRKIFIDRLVTKETVNWYKGMYSNKNKGWDYTKEFILQMDRRCKERNIVFVLAIWPIFYDFSHYPFKDIHEKILSFCKENNILAVDCLNYFDRVNYRDFIVHPLDYHPNKNAHLVMARVIDNFLRQKVKGR